MKSINSKSICSVGMSLMIKLQLILTFLIFFSTSIIAQVGVLTDFPDASAAMEISSINKGLLIPRVALTANLSDPSPVTAPATGLMIFNNGSNQPIGFYYWNGTQWVAVAGSGGGGTDFWSLYGNSGTTPGTHFLGTTDMQDFTIFTDGSERMRIESDGQVLVGASSAYNTQDLFTAVGRPGLDYAVNAYSPYIGVWSAGDYCGFRTETGKYGLMAIIDTALGGCGVYSRNLHASGYGILASGSGYGIAYSGSRSAAISARGGDGMMSWGAATNGTGIIAAGSSESSLTYLSTGSGGAFCGYHGLVAQGRNPSGTGVVGMGNNVVAAYTMPVGSGGSFTGYHGIYSKAIDPAAGIGVIGLGNNLSSYLTSPNGSGGAFAGSDGLIAQGTNSTSGTGIIGVGNNLTNIPTIAAGSGGGFTGNICGVYGYAANTSGDRYGGYFATGGGGYAYVGCRYSNTNRKIVGVGNVSTIVTNTKGERVTLVCPEAPESVFQDFGIGQLIDGKAHITIDPDLAINITVNEKHPLKVYITPKGDCNGVYVTNKSPNGFDVIELQGGRSNIPFSWQIVAIRANEEIVLEDGSVMISDYSQRFQEAPPPLPVNMLQLQQNYPEEIPLQNLPAEEQIDQGTEMKQWEEK